MIALRRLNNSEFILNADYIEALESTPDTVISLVNGKKLVVKDPVEDVVRKAIRYRQLCNQTLQVVHRGPDESGRADVQSAGRK